MNIIIGDKKYSTWDEPHLPKKSNNTVIIFHDKFEDDDIPDLIILDKHKYQWILKGCKLIKKEYIPTSYKPIGNSFKTHLTISYESRSGSHIKEVIKGEIRDWNIDKIIGL